MTLNARQKKILELARATGEVEIDVLAQKFDVTSQTIRRDINALCDNRLLERYHAVPLYRGLWKICIMEFGNMCTAILKKPSVVP
ncbi:hypothetical protein JCM17846_17670 [Iodidimonas nitroreducens]|uniref:HTH deoR-type domain-containing protein n=1 Tax=Iodidimonas nitroreducens TaxID=1236968 RepID=A0A5A7N8Y6_9PROT|nr:hypothetical protein JCM17846_17670 [Iodidimonas nitroreducens]